MRETIVLEVLSRPFLSPEETLRLPKAGKSKTKLAPKFFQTRTPPRHVGHCSRRADHRSTRRRALRQAVVVPGRRLAPSSPEIAGKSSGFVIAHLARFLKRTCSSSLSG